MIWRAFLGGSEQSRIPKIETEALRSGIFFTLTVTPASNLSGVDISLSEEAREELSELPDKKIGSEGIFASAWDLYIQLERIDYQLGELIFYQSIFWISRSKKSAMNHRSQVFYMVRSR
jgi:hypothetical protein